MNGMDFGLIGTILLAAAGILWVATILLWFGLRLPEEIAEVWKAFRPGRKK